MLVGQSITKHWGCGRLPLVFGALLLVCTAGCTQANTIQLPPLPLSDSVSQSIASTPEPIVTNPEPETESPTAMPTEIPLFGRSIFQFQEGEPGWYTVDDDVMGGVSDSEVSVIFSQTGPDSNLVEGYRLLFSGIMSLENNGGFSSVRSDWAPIDLSEYDGILLRVLGDGKSYRLRIRTTEFGSSISYNALFRTEAEKWRLAYVPFDEMVPTRRGFVMDVGQLDSATVASFGFMLSDKQPGEFALQVDWMRAITTADLQNLDQSQ